MELSGIRPEPSMLQDRRHAGCGPYLRLNDWLGLNHRQFLARGHDVWQQRFFGEAYVPWPF